MCVTLVMHCWAAHHCIRGSNPDACERSPASHAVYRFIQCTPLLVEKAGVAPDVTFGITTCKQERVQARDPLWIWNPWGMTHAVQNRSNQWLHKMGLGPTIFFYKKQKNIWGWLTTGIPVQEPNNQAGGRGDQLYEFRKVKTGLTP